LWALETHGLSLTVVGGVAILMAAWALAFAEPAMRHAAKRQPRPGMDPEAVDPRRLALGPPPYMWSVDAWLDAVADRWAPAFFTGALKHQAGSGGSWTGTLTEPLERTQPATGRHRADGPQS
jgi:hypothetical protein